MIWRGGSRLLASHTARTGPGHDPDEDLPRLKLDALREAKHKLPG